MCFMRREATDVGSVEMREKDPSDSPADVMRYAKSRIIADKRIRKGRRDGAAKMLSKGVQESRLQILL